MDGNLEKLLKENPERVQKIKKLLEQEENDDEGEEEIVEKVTCRMRLGYLFSWVPFLNRLGWWRWILLYLASVIFVWGLCFKAYLFWFVLQTKTQPSINDAPDYIDLEKNTVVLADDVPQELCYESLSSAYYLIYNGRTIHVSQCFWCLFDQAHFWGGVIASGVALFTAGAIEAIKATVKWSISFCDENIVATNKKTRRQKRQRESAEKEKKPWISRPRSSYGLFASKNKKQK